MTALFTIVFIIACILDYEQNKDRWEKEKDEWEYI